MKILKWLGIAFLVVVVVGMFAGGGNNSGSATEASGKAAAKPREVVKVSAGQLFASYEDNEVATDETFKGKNIEVSGTVQSIDKDAFENILIAFKTSNQFMPAHMKMEDSEKGAAMVMKKGIKATVLCEKMSRIVGSPYGSGCRFVAEDPVKKKTAG